MARTTAAVQMDTFHCDARMCDVAHEVRPDGDAPGFRLIVSDAQLRKIGLNPANVDEDQREIYAHSEGHIGKATVAVLDRLTPTTDEDSADEPDPRDEADEPDETGALPDDVTADNDGHDAEDDDRSADALLRTSS